MQVLEAGAILFDMDGTLIDSNRCVDRAWRAWCAATGVALEEVARVSHGAPCRQTIARVAPHLDTDREVARYEALELWYGDDQAPVAGAGALLDALPAERWTLVTSAAARIAQFRFRQCRLPYPAAPVTAESVRRGKPSPEPFLLGAERLGLSPRDCLVFEDSPAGVQAGLAAGCRVVVVGDLDARQPGVVARIQDYRSLRVDTTGPLRITLPAAA